MIISVVPIIDYDQYLFGRVKSFDNRDGVWICRLLFSTFCWNIINKRKCSSTLFSCYKHTISSGYNDGTKPIRLCDTTLASGGRGLAVTRLTSNPGVISSIQRRTSLSHETLSRDPMYQCLTRACKRTRVIRRKRVGSYTRDSLYLIPSR